MKLENDKQSEDLAKLKKRAKILEDENLNYLGEFEKFMAKMQTFHEAF